MCIIDGCDTKPIFNIKGSKPRYCKTHKTNDMINVKNPICIEEGCDTRPNFNYKEEKKRIILF